TVSIAAAVLRRDVGATSDDAPVINVLGAASQQFVKDVTLAIKGTVTAKRCTSAVSVNGAAADLVGTGTDISFSYSLALPSGDADVPVSIVATDCDGRVGKLDYTVTHDDVAPTIEVDLSPSPAVHNVSTTPFMIAGKITESHL